MKFISSSSAVALVALVNVGVAGLGFVSANPLSSSSSDVSQNNVNVNVNALDGSSSHIHAAGRRNAHSKLAARRNRSSSSASSASFQKKRAAAGRRVRRAGDESSGSVCKIRGSAGSAAGTSTVWSSSSSAAAAATSASSTQTQAAWSSSSSSAPAWTSQPAPEPTSTSTSIWVEPTTSAWVEPTTSASWVAPAPSAAPSSPAWSGSAGTSGLGIAWPNGDWASPGSPDAITNYIGSKASWYYTWSGYGVSSGDNAGLEFVPMLWGPGHTGDWWNNVAGWGGNVKNVMFFNEPDIGAQANVNAWDAVSYWQQYMSPLKAQGHRLGMAATTSGSAGLQWINDFRTACPSCWDEVDFIPIHYYYNSVSNFQDYVTNFHAQTNKPLWVTEYACHNFAGGAQCSPDDTWNFHTSMDRWFSEQWFVERWAPFGVMKNMQGVEQANALMDPSGAITALGAWYISSA